LSEGSERLLEIGITRREAIANRVQSTLCDYDAGMEEARSAARADHADNSRAAEAGLTGSANVPACVARTTRADLTSRAERSSDPGYTG